MWGVQVSTVRFLRAIGSSAVLPTSPSPPLLSDSFRDGHQAAGFALYQLKPKAFVVFVPLTHFAVFLLLADSGPANIRSVGLVALRAAVRFRRPERAAGKAGRCVLLVVDPVCPQDPWQGTSATASIAPRTLRGLLRMQRGRGDTAITFMGENDIRGGDIIFGVLWRTLACWMERLCLACQALHYVELIMRISLFNQRGAITALRLRLPIFCFALVEPLLWGAGGLDRWIQAEELYPEVPRRRGWRYFGAAGQPGRYLPHLFWDCRPVPAWVFRRQVGCVEQVVAVSQCIFSGVTSLTWLNDTRWCHALDAIPAKTASRLGLASNTAFFRTPETKIT